MLSRTHTYAHTLAQMHTHTHTHTYANTFMHIYTNVGKSCVQYISCDVHLHRALVQDLEQLKGSTTMLSEPVVVERPSGLNPQLFHLQKDYMSARLETKEEQIRQLEQQLRALQQMVADRTKVIVRHPEPFPLQQVDRHTTQ